VGRYFFHLHYGEYTPDVEGSEFESAQEARDSALRYLSELLRDQGHRFWEPSQVTITVTDEWNLMLWQLDLKGMASPSVASGGGYGLGK